MDKRYIKIFGDLALSTANTAKAVMGYNQKQNDEKGVETATTMYNDFTDLAQRIKDAGDDYKMNKADAAKLLVGTAIMVNQLQEQLNIRKNAIEGYQVDIAPKLQKVLDSATDDNEAKQIAEENFIIENKENI